MNADRARHDRRIKNGGTEQGEAERHECVTDMQDEDQSIGDGAVAGPAGEPGGLRTAKNGPGNRPFSRRASQLCVKLGTMRPPTSVINTITAAIPIRMP